jgi:hypothetical protein
MVEPATTGVAAGETVTDATVAAGPVSDPHAARRIAAQTLRVFDCLM